LRKYSRVVGKYRLLLLLAFSSLLFLMLVSGVAAWKNGKSVGLCGYSQHTGTWHNYKYNVDYGTHDWLADFAVERTLKNPVLVNKWKDSEGNPFWVGENWRVYLHGTYGPDEARVIHYTRYNQLIKGEGDKRAHRIMFNDNKDIVYSAPADQARLCGKAAVYALQDGDCRTAAFFMGEMAHYIGDMCSIGNVYHRDYSASSDRPSEWKSVMDSLDYNTLVRTMGSHWYKDPSQGVTGAWTRTFEPNDRTTIFWIENGLFVPYVGLDPGQLARGLAYNTYCGANYHTMGTYDWNWMWDALSTEKMKEGGKWPLDETWHTTWDKAEIPYLFFSRLEESLNFGIKYIASALNWVIDTAGGNWECKSNPYDPDVDASMARYLNIMLKDSFLRVFSFTGIYGTLFAISFSTVKLEQYKFA